MSAKTIEHYFRHARRRALQRYDLHLEMPDYLAMVKVIQQGKAMLLFRESNARSHWLIEDRYIAVYDNTRKGISTFLPPEAIINYCKA